jgi:hypothetical protein
MIALAEQGLADRGQYDHFGLRPSGHEDARPV